MNIAIWGAGEFGGYVLKQLLKNSTVNIICIIDNYSDLKEKEGVVIVKPIDFLAKYNNMTDRVLVAFWNGITIRNQIEELGIRIWGVVNNYVLKQRLKLSENIQEDRNIIWNTDREFSMPFMETLETQVVDYCNLNCKGCSHFSNIFPKGKQLPYEIFERDIKYLSSKIYVGLFNLLGGEVLLNERIEDYILCIGNYMPKTKIILVTNGLLIPGLKKEVFECMVKYSAGFSITEYAPVRKMKDRIIAVLEQNGVSYEFRENKDTFGKNIDLSGENDPKKMQSMCRESLCQFLRDGKIFKCPFSALGNYFFEYYGIPLVFQEGIDIFDKNVDWQSISEKLRKQPIEACKYCGLEEQFAWEVSRNPQKEDWLICGDNQ